MLYKTYFSKDNVIYLNDQINVGKNSIGELMSSSINGCPVYSRYIFKFETDHLTEKYNNCELNLLNTTHTLKIYPTGTLDCNLDIAVKGEIILFKINQDWDEGTGHDENCKNICGVLTTNKCNIVEEPSNWFYAKQGIQWENQGIYHTYENVISASTETIEFLPISNANCDCISGETVCVEIMPPLTNLTGNTCDLQPQIQCEDLYDFSGGTVINPSNCILNPALEYYEEFEISATTEILASVEISSDSYCGFEIDMTDIVNDLITGTTENHGYGLAFIPEQERASIGHLQFHTRQSNSLFKPTLITDCKDYICDNRYAFYNGEQNRLFLYSKFRLDQNPIVKILDDECNELAQFTAECMENYYYVEFSISGLTEDVTFIDQWTNLIYNGNSLEDIVQQFNTTNRNLFDLNHNINEYWVGISGIKNKEHLTCGDQRKVKINAQPKNGKCNAFEIINAEYRIYTPDGICDIDIIPWRNLNKDGCNLWFNLDTTWLLPTTYYIEIKVETTSGIYTHTNKREFSIICSNNCC